MTTPDVITADSFAKLLEVARPRVKALGSAIEVVCGPISTGGQGSVERNLRAFGAVIDALVGHGRVVFDQRPYEAAIFALRARWRDEDPARKDAYCTPILEEFYRPLYVEYPITVAWFLPGWESSRGTCWEHALLRAKGTDIRYLDPEWTLAAFEGFSVEKPVYRTKIEPG